jgi:hypothetical protein
MTPSDAHDMPPLQLPRALHHLHTQRLTLNDADQVLAMRRDVLTGMPSALRAVDPSRACLPEVESAWAATHLGPRARTMGIFDGSVLVAFACLLLADADNPDDPAHVLGLPASEWERTAHMAICLVAEDYRGLNLQSTLLDWRRAVATRHRRTLLLAMTACGNEYSRRNLLAAGMSIHWVGQWRPGTWWYGMVQDLDAGPPPATGREHEWVGLSHIERQTDLLASGYVGVAEMAVYGEDGRKEPQLQFVRRPFRPLKPAVAASDDYLTSESVQ